MIALVQRLEQQGFTYRTKVGVIFDTSKFADYGKFAKLNLEGQKRDGIEEIKGDGTIVFPDAVHEAMKKVLDFVARSKDAGSKGALMSRTMKSINPSLRSDLIHSVFEPLVSRIVFRCMSFANSASVINACR